MDRWIAALSRPQETPLQTFERSLIDVSRAELEKNAGELTEYIDTLFDAPAKTPRVDRLLEQTKTAARMGRELAREQGRIKEAGIAGTVMGAIKPMAGKALGWAAQHPGHAMAAGGAALGAAGGAMAGGPGHRLGGALTGAGLGATVGGLASKIPMGGGANLGNSVSQAAGAKAVSVGVRPPVPSMHAPAAAVSVDPSYQKAMEKVQQQQNAASNMIRNAGAGGGGSAPGFRGQKKVMSGQTVGGMIKGASLLSSGLGRAGIGAAVGGTLGMLHSNDVARQGLAPAHGMRDALIGAAGGAALGGALHKMPVPSGGGGAVAAAEGALSKTHLPSGNTLHNYGSPVSPGAQLRQKLRGLPYTPSGGAAATGVASAATPAAAAVHAPSLSGYSPVDLKQMERVKSMANSQRGVSALGPTANLGKPKMAGAAFIKMAFSMSAQAEPGTPGGAQEPEQSDEQIVPPSPPAPMVRPPSKPAVELFGALKHLSPKLMRGLQVAQPGT